MSEGFQTHREADASEDRIESTVRGLAREIRLEVRWLILASVALNQILSNVNLSSVASAAVGVGILGAGVAVKLILLSSS